MNKLSIISRQTGFTLIEVLVALVIVGTGLMAIVSAVTSSAKVTSAVEQKMLASWVAANRYAELRLHTASFSVGINTDSVEMGGQRWRYQQNISETDDPDVYAVQIEVYLESNPELLQVSVFSYIGKPLP